MSMDNFGNFVIDVNALNVALLDKEKFVEWISTYVSEAEAMKCNGILVRLRGTATALVDNFSKYRTDFKIRDWIREQDGPGYLELHRPLSVKSIPAYKTSRIGILVVLADVEEKNVIVVKERFGPTQFKFCTGAVEVGEDAVYAAMREVKEELGIVASERDFVLKAVHQEKNARYQVDDYCFVYLCRVANLDVCQFDEFELLDWKKIAIAGAEKDETLTVYTKSLIGSIFSGKSEPVPLLRGKKELVSYKTQ